MPSKNRKTTTTEVVQPGPDQKQIYPAEIEDADLSTIESATERENQAADEANVEAVEQTSRDYWGRGSQETDGAVPSDPPDTDPLQSQDLRNPTGPPDHNM